MDQIKYFRSLVLPDVITIEPSVFKDTRGVIYTSYDENYLDLLPKGMRFVKDKFTLSKGDVLRGLHGDTKMWKLVSCVSGMIYEVVVDMRFGSPTFKKHIALILRPGGVQVLIPPGFLNGYYAYIDSMYHYKFAYEGEYVDKDEQMTVKWDSLGIPWPCKKPIISERDNL